MAQAATSYPGFHATKLPEVLLLIHCKLGGSVAGLCSVVLNSTPPCLYIANWSDTHHKFGLFNKFLFMYLFFCFFFCFLFKGHNVNYWDTRNTKLFTLFAVLERCCVLSILMTQHHDLHLYLFWSYAFNTSNWTSSLLFAGKLWHSEMKSKSRPK